MTRPFWTENSRVLAPLILLKILWVPHSSPALTVAGLVIDEQTYPCMEHHHLSSVNSGWGSSDIHLAECAQVRIFVFICPDSFMCYILHVLHPLWMPSHGVAIPGSEGILWPAVWGICCHAASDKSAQNCIELLLPTSWCKDHLNYLEKRLLRGNSNFLFGNKTLFLFSLWFHSCLYMWHSSINLSNNHFKHTCKHPCKPPIQHFQMKPPVLGLISFSLALPCHVACCLSFLPCFTFIFS